MRYAKIKIGGHRRLPLYLILCLVPGLLVGWRFWQSYPGDLFAPNHQLVVRDYLNIWAGGRLATDGRLDLIFDPRAYADWLTSIFGHRLDLHVWGYPPHFLLLAIPFSQLPLVPGFVVWTVATGVFLWTVLRAGGLPRPYAFAVALSPAALENALDGQNGALIAAALAGGLLLAERRPVPAGALLGLLTIKPQLGLLVPICLLARRDFRTITTAAVFGLGYCGAGAVVFGWGAWRTYLTVTAPFMRNFVDAPFGLAAHFMMVPPFITMRAIGASLTLAYTVQAVVSLSCLALSYWAWSRRSVDRRLAIALVLCLAPLTTPYSHSYDLIVVAVACATLAKVAEERNGLYTPEWFILFLAWVWPSIALVIGILVGPGLGAFIVGMVAWVAIRLISMEMHNARETGQAIPCPTGPDNANAVP
jgi:hypothetical protein